ncbi:hypothetical protein C3438_21750 (plasmid) [Bacillus velezensis]|nr:hypothetical protein C3438_21750 [Bacillus velezensis]AYK76595.1 hypothetical protein D9C12_22900 [Bacillus subtilis subsp. subtilis]AYL03225.1 hypothetical protein D9C08_23055 [Bacillus subtilis subsp. subtilis]OCB96060.1 hypothetical protein SRCM101294_01698 [Bacillus amyloliquefaciens]
MAFFVGLGLLSLVLLGCVCLIRFVKFAFIVLLITAILVYFTKLITNPLGILAIVLIGLIIFSSMGKKER